MIATPQLLALFKEMLLCQPIEHNILRFGNEQRKNDGGEWHRKKPADGLGKNFFFGLGAPPPL